MYRLYKYFIFQWHGLYHGGIDDYSQSFAFTNFTEKWEPGPGKEYICKNTY